MDRRSPIMWNVQCFSLVDRTPVLRGIATVHLFAFSTPLFVKNNIHAKLIVILIDFSSLNIFENTPLWRGNNFFLVKYLDIALWQILTH